MQLFDKAKWIMTNIKALIFSEKFSVLMVCISLIGLVSSVIIFIICGDWSFSSILDEGKVAQFGDFVGGVIGTILAFAASLLYYIALKEQQRDIKINQKSLEKQIEEFGKQVEELELSRKVYMDQHKTMLHQQFENNFFAYFDIYLKVKEQLDRKSKQSDYFLDSFRCLSSIVKFRDIQGKSSKEAYDFTINKYSDFFISKRETFSHYFRTMYRLVSIVTSSHILTDSDKMKYIKIIRSQLTEKELLLIYYDIHSPYSGKARQVFYEYNLLKHLPPLSKIEIKNKYQISESSSLKIASFIDSVSSSIISFINKVCDNPEDLPDPYSIEVEYEPLKCILKIEITDTIDFSLVYSDTKIIPNNFKDIFRDYLCDLLYISQFKHPANFLSIDQSVDKISRNIIINYKLPVEEIHRIIIDKK